MFSQKYNFPPLTSTTQVGLLHQVESDTKQLICELPSTACYCERTFFIILVINSKARSDSQCNRFLKNIEFGSVFRDKLDLILIWFHSNYIFIWQQGCIQLIKSDDRDIMLQKISVSNTCCSFELSIHQGIMKNACFSKNMNHHNYFQHR